MEMAMHGIRDLVSLSHLMRQYGQDATLPGYRENFLRAAAELDAQVARQTTQPSDNRSTPAGDEKLHQGVDLKV
jgi:hypothetical protein